MITQINSFVKYKPFYIFIFIMQNRFFRKNGNKRNFIFIGKLKKHFSYEETEESNMIQSIDKPKSNWFRKFLSWTFHILILFLKWLWSHPKKLITSILSAIGLWLLSFLPFKLPNLPFFPIPIQQSKPQETKKDDKKEDKKPEEKKEDNNQESKPVDQSKTNIVTTTNVITQTNLVTQTNYVTETKYITNFVVQPIVVTNTIFKEVPIIVTNVLVIKNNVTDTNNNSGNNKNRVLNGPAFYFTEDFNTLLQNQQQNPIKGQIVN